MQQLQSNLINHWNRYAVVIIMITLAILKDKQILSQDVVLDIQYVLALAGFLPANPRQILSKSRKVAPLLLLFLLFQCKPKPTLEQQTRAQVETKIQKDNEKIVDTVTAQSQSDVDSTLANNSEFQKLWNHFSELVTQ